MSLTLGPGPLGTQPGGDVNYAIDGPQHRIWFPPHPRRIRPGVAVRGVLDTVGAWAPPQTAIPPRFYVPREDVTANLVPSGKRTFCPYKGEATYFSVRLGDRVIEDAAWSYEQPFSESLGIAGLISFLHDEVRAS